MHGLETLKRLNEEAEVKSETRYELDAGELSSRIELTLNEFRAKLDSGLTVRVGEVLDSIEDVCVNFFN